MTRLEQSRPEQVDVTDWTGETTLVVGAPAIGKTRLARQAADDATATYTTDLQEAVTASDDEFVLLDDFYPAYRQADSDHQRAFEGALDREQGICVLARPRGIDWVLDTDETGLDGDVLDAFDRVCFLQYDAEDADERERAVRACLDIGADADDAPAGLSESAVRSNLDLLEHPAHEFESDRLADLAETYGPTMVPGLVVSLSEMPTDGALFSRDVFSDFAAGITLSGVYDAGKSALSDVFTDAGIGTVALAGAGASAGAGPAALAGAGALVVWTLLGDDTDESILDTLLDAHVLPTAKPRIERKLGLPPRTIDAVDDLASGDTLQTLQRLPDDAPEKVREFERRTSEYDDQLAELGDELDTLREAVTSPTEFEAFVSDRLADAVRGLDALEDGLLHDEKAILTEVDIDVLLDSYRGEEHETIAARVTDHDVVPVVGPSGTGKTTASVKACRALESAGYDVAVPQFEQGPAFVDEAVRTRLEASDRSVVFVSYKRAGAAPGHGEGDTPFESKKALTKLFEWVREGVCSAVILECRAEHYSALTDDLDTISMASRLSEDVKVEFDRFDTSNDDDEATMWDVTEWAFDRLDADPDAETVEEVVDFADGNPEVAKLAAHYEATGQPSRSIKDVETVPELVYDQVSSVLGSDDNEQKQLFEYLSAVGVMTTEEIETVLEIGRDQLQGYAKQLAGYLGGDIRDKLNRSYLSLDDDDTWEISPDVYADGILRRKGIKKGDIQTRYLGTIETAEQFQLLPRLGQRLGTVYGWEAEADGGSPDAVLDAVEEWYLPALREMDIEPAVFFRSQAGLVGYDVPLAVEEVRDDESTLFEGAEAGSEDFDDYDGEVLLENYLAYLLGNHAVRNEKGDVQSVSTLAGEFARSSEERADADPGLFLENVYAMVVSNLAERYEVEEVESWVSWVAEQAGETAAARQYHDDVPGQFLANVYAMVVSKLADESEVEEVESWVSWVAEQAGETAAARQYHDTDPGLFLTNVYAMVVRHLAGESEVEEVESWVSWTVTQVAETASAQQYHDTLPARFLAETLSMAAWQVTEGQFPSTPNQWHTDLLDRTEDVVPDLTLFYVSYHKWLATGGQHPEQWIPWLVADAIQRVTRPTDPLVADHSERVDLLASLLSDMAVACQQGASEGLDRGSFLAALEHLATLVTADTDLFTETVTTTTDRLASGPVSDWAIPDGWGDFQWDRVSRRFAHRAYVIAFDTLASEDSTDQHRDALGDAMLATADHLQRPETWTANTFANGAAVVADARPAWRTDLLGRALDAADVETVATEFAGVFTDPDHIRWLTEDLLARTSDEQAVAAIAAVVQTVWQDSGGDSRAFDAITDAVADGDDEFQERVATTLEDDHGNFVAALDWREAFGLV